jgi:hypothetical protein
MKKSILAIAFAGAVFCAGLTLQSCAETTYPETPYATTTTYTTYGPYGAHSYSATEPEYYSYYEPSPSYGVQYYSYPPYPTYSEPDSVVGSTAHAVGTIVAAPFRIVGDTVDTIF